MDEKLNILVLEDEQRAGEKLIDMIRRLCPEANIEWKRSMLEGELYIQESPQLDLIYSDIELLDGNVFRMYEKLALSCPIIFCTAYNQYFLEAFRSHGIAYLLKPFSFKEFEESWQKYQTLFSPKEKKAAFSQDLKFLKSLIEKEAQQYKNTFTVKKKDGVFLLKVEEVLFFQSQGDFVLALDVMGKKHVLNYTLQKLEELLDPMAFFRLNRSEILAFEFIQHFSPYTKNRLAIKLLHSQYTLYTSNSRSPKFREWVERH